jgi:hypothetical protein
VTSSSQEAPHGQSDFTREIVGLIEPATQETNRMQRYWHHGVGAFEDIHRPPAHQSGQRPSELAFSLKFERVDQLPQRAFVCSRASCE